MRRSLTTIMLAMALIAPVAALTAAKSPKLAKCDGRQRRSANPYGSILPTVDPQAGTTTPAESGAARGGVDVFPVPSSTPAKPARPDGAPSIQVPPISSLNLPTPYRSC